MDIETIITKLINSFNDWSALRRTLEANTYVSIIVEGGFEIQKIRFVNQHSVILESNGPFCRTLTKVDFDDWESVFLVFCDYLPLEMLDAIEML